MKPTQFPYLSRLACSALILTCFGLAGCRTPGRHRSATDNRVDRIIEQKQAQALGHSEAFTIERPWESMRRELTFAQGLPYSGPESLGIAHLEKIEHWPKDDYGERPEDAEPVGLPEGAAEMLHLTLTDVLRVAAANSREYQTRKEEVYRAALDLDLERDRFRSTFTGIFKGTATHDRTGSGTPTGVISNSLGEASLSLSKRFLNGILFTTRAGVDVAKSFFPGSARSKSVWGDASITIPLMRGWGKHIAGEPLTQAERDALYAILNFERFKRIFAVRVASEYLAVLRQIDQVKNAEENYRGLVASARRARRLADAGLLSEVQVDQAKQDELRSRNGWISAREQLDRQTDAFKSTLGLPTDARVEFDRGDLELLAEAVRDVINPPGAVAEGEVKVPPADAPVVLREPTLEGAGPYELDPEYAVALALENRLDLRVARDRVHDAQRALVVAADALRAEVTLLGEAAIGARRSRSDGGLDDADDPSFDEGVYTGILTIDLPFERTREQRDYRNAWIDLEKSVRAVQELEDQIKLEVRNKLRDLLESREGLQIQAQATTLAQRRVRSSTLFLEAGRVQIRDLLEAQEDLLSAQNALTTAMVGYRIAELELQRDLGLLAVDSDGLWKEFDPEEHNRE